MVHLISRINHAHIKFYIPDEWEGPTMRVNITLACTECGERNYISKKNKRNNPERIEMKKYCSRDKKQTLHRETK